MSLVHRAEFLDDFFWFIAQLKNSGCPEQLRLTRGIAERRLRELKLAIRELLDSPQGADLVEHQVYTVEQASRVPLDTEMLYVKTLLQLAYIATLKSAGGIHLAATRPVGGTDPLSKESIAKLERKKQQQELTLKITHSWTPDMVEYQVGITSRQIVPSVSLAASALYVVLVTGLTS